MTLKGFWMGKYEVTRGQWRKVMQDSPGSSDNCGWDCPVESVDWFAVLVFLDYLNKKDRRNRYRLPTEAEWEWAVRAGTGGPRYEALGDIAWYKGNARTPHMVGQKDPNAWGLFDMLGNVAEYCLPTRHVTIPRRVTRGGSFLASHGGLRAAFRLILHGDQEDTGFRCIREEK